MKVIAVVHHCVPLLAYFGRQVLAHTDIQYGQDVAFLETRLKQQGQSL